MKVALVQFFVLLAMPAAAQVFKCESPTGQVQYSDQPCGPGRYLGSGELRANSLDTSAVRREVEMDRRRAAAERRLDAQAAAANQDPGLQMERFKRNCPSELEIKNLETGASSLTPARGARFKLEFTKRVLTECSLNGFNRGLAEQTIHQQMHSENQRAAREAAATAEATAREVTQNTPAPTAITSCTGGGCWDNAGNRYNGTASDNTLFRSDGKVCQRIGNILQCN